MINVLDFGQRVQRTRRTLRASVSGLNDEEWP
jgi:hypothetical protein